MKIGFTGTRHGMTLRQKLALRDTLVGMRDVEGHHGDCVGADATFHDFCGRLNFRRVVHPPVDKSHAANVSVCEECRPEKTHFARNRDIVDECDMLIATPWHSERPAPKTGGGTWYTVEYAEKQGKPVHIIWPNGSVEMLHGHAAARAT